MTKNKNIDPRAEDFALLVENHTFLVDGQIVILDLNTLGSVEKTNHLKNDIDLINKLQNLVNMVNDDLSLLYKDIQTELWDMVNDNDPG